MKTLFIILLFILLGVPCEINADTSLAPNPNVQFDKSTIIKKRLAAAEKYIEGGDYQSAMSSLKSVLNLDPSNNKAKELLRECDNGIEQQKRLVDEAYSQAVDAGSKSALEEFIAKYPQSELVSSAKSRIEDYDLWSKADKDNTIEAYKNYLKDSDIQAYADEANNRIENITADMAWSQCENSDDEELLINYISNFPQSSNVVQAKYRLNIIKGEKYYNQGDLSSAYTYLNDANNYMVLTGLPASHFKQIREEQTYKDIISSSDINTVKNYLFSMSTLSPHYNDISDHYALLLARDLDAFSTKYNYQVALSYAKSPSTIGLVKYYIKNVEKRKKYYNHQRLQYNHKLWWKSHFQIGWNIIHADILENSLTIGTGLRFRFGSWSDVFNFITGIEYSYILYMPWDEDDEAETVGHQLEIPLTFRFNICKIALYDARLYVGCTGAIGLKIAEGTYARMNNPSIAIQPELGIADKNWDFGVYYRKYLNNYNVVNAYFNDFDSQRVGLFIMYYF